MLKQLFTYVRVVRCADLSAYGHDNSVTSYTQSSGKSGVAIENLKINYKVEKMKKEYESRIERLEQESSKKYNIVPIQSS